MLRCASCPCSCGSHAACCAVHHAPAAAEAVLCIMHLLLHVLDQVAEEEERGIDLGISVQDSDALVGVHAHAAVAAVPAACMQACVLPIRRGLACPPHRGDGPVNQPIRVP